MEWIKALSGSLVALDTAPFIYFIEEHPTYLSHLRPFFEAVDQGEIRVVTSSLTLTEVLVHPIRRGATDLADRYRNILLEAVHITTVPVTEQVAEDAARLRATHGLRTPDAIQIFTAQYHGASAFLTNDLGLRGYGLLKLLILDRLIDSA